MIKNLSSLKETFKRLKDQLHTRRCFQYVHFKKDEYTITTNKKIDTTIYKK